MQQLDSKIPPMALEELAREARNLANGDLMPRASEHEVRRQLQICNACRYCEGFCAVFPAMTRRLEFGKADIHYLANLCHSCGACLHACQYAAPHEFAVNVPQAMSKVRVQTYSDYAWPQWLGGLYRHNGLTVSLALAAGLTLFLALALALKGSLFQAPLQGGFYTIFPHNLLVSLFTPVFVFSIVALCLGVRRFWRDVAGIAVGAEIDATAVRGATLDALSLKYLGGGHGEGCNNDDDAWTLWRRRFHHATFYGFMLCFAATTVATCYHYLLGHVAPYDLPSIPKLLGAAGGISLLVGTAGLLMLNLSRHPLHDDPEQKPMDRGFIVLLFLISLSGLALWLGRSTTMLASLLAMHLGLVMALFATLPYGKFAHGIFRSAALLKWAIEKRR